MAAINVDNVSVNPCRVRRWLTLVVGFGLAALACGSDERNPSAGDGAAQSGSGGQAGDNTGGQSAGDGGAAGQSGAEMGGAGGSLTTVVPDGGVGSADAGVNPNLPMVGDSLVDEDNSKGVLVFPPDAGLVPNVQGVPVGEPDPQLGDSFACVHIDLESGGYVVVGNNESPDPRLEPVVSFAYADGQFGLYVFYPWNLYYVVPELPPPYLPTDSVTTVELSRDDVVLRLRVQVEGDRVAVLSIVVAAIGPISSQ